MREVGSSRLGDPSVFGVAFEEEEVEVEAEGEVQNHASLKESCGVMMGGF